MADHGALAHTASVSRRVTGTEALQNLAPITGWEAEPTVSLLVATKDLPVKDIALHAQVALEAGEDYKFEHPEDPRSEDQLGAAHLYTQGWAVAQDSLYFVLNNVLSQDDRAALVVWFSFLKLLFTCLMAEPMHVGTLWRGVTGDVGSQYTKGKKFRWWRFSSCTEDGSVLDNPLFLGTAGKRTLFSIDCKSGVRINHLSAYSSEAEVILAPGTRFVVANTIVNGDLTVVNLKEIASGFPAALPKSQPKVPEGNPPHGSVAQPEPEAADVGAPSVPQRITHRGYPDLPFDGYSQQTLFPQINLSFPGLQLVHEKPYIFIVNNFMSPGECERLIHKASKRGQRSRGGNNGCKCCVMFDEEIPTLRSRFVNLTATVHAQLQPLQVSSYEPGKEFGRHVDSHWGVNTVMSSSDKKTDFFNEAGRRIHGIRELKGVPCANRFMTVFVYLKDIKKGGRTMFRWTTEDPSFYDTPTPCNAEAIPFAAPDDEHGVAIRPEIGLAVIHFGATTPETGGLCDRNTAHVSEVVHGEQKWICQQFIYSHPLPDYSGIGTGDKPEHHAVEPDLSDVL